MPTQAQLDELDAIIATLKEHPERHRQDTYVQYEGKNPPVLTPVLDCGSAFCIAGAAVARAGIGVTWFRSVIDGVWYANQTTLQDETGWSLSISRVAAELLGLDWSTADELFSGANTMEDIERIRAGLAASDEVTESVA